MDLRWPKKQLNVLLDQRSLNDSERSTVKSLFKELQSKTCIKVKELSSEQVRNPFQLSAADSAPDDKGDDERNFLYIFRSQKRTNALVTAPGALGLSSLGCVHQGRQSVVLSELAFRFPELVLRYHVLRSLGLDNVERPDGEVRRLLNMLPLSQRITSEPAPSGQLSPQDNPLSSSANFYAFAVGPSVKSSGREGSYLSSADVEAIKGLYECGELQSRLSLGPPLESAGERPAREREAEPAGNKPEESAKQTIEAPQPDGPTTSEPPRQANTVELNETAKSIVDYLLSTEDEAKRSKKLDEVFDLDRAASGTPPPIDGRQEEFDKLDSLFDRADNKQPQQQQCKPLETCPLPGARPEALPSGPFDANGNSLFLRERPMLLKLDEFHAQDPQLKQANQMKLMQGGDAWPTGSSYRLMNQAELPFGASGGLGQLFGQPSGSGAPQSQPAAGSSQAKQEMVISFEQTPASSSGGPIAAVASSQVLKLCSCTCQTMTPQASGESSRPTSGTTSGGTFTLGPLLPTQASEQPPATVSPPFPFPSPDNGSEWPRPPSSDPFTYGPPPASTLYPPFVWPPLSVQPNGSSGDWPPFTQPPDNWWEQTPPPSSPAASSTAAPAPPVTTLESTTHEFQELTSTSATLPPSTPTDGPKTSASSEPLSAANACDQVEWVRPNKTVYGSARIVWDVDRGNQNYFLCQSTLNGELIPGKTHAFSCKLSQEGKAYEMHSFSVLTKPEHINLAWVRRSSASFGRHNLPVVGGHSKQGQEPYIVARCLVKDENNDVITLIGYVNNQGVGWFPFDDIQIECAQYDVLACVS